MNNEAKFIVRYESNGRGCIIWGNNRTGFERLDTEFGGRRPISKNDLDKYYPFILKDFTAKDLVNYLTVTDLTFSSLGSGEPMSGKDVLPLFLQEIL
jgi:hypothetical protein